MADHFPDLPPLQQHYSLSTNQETKRLNILKIPFYVLFLLCFALSLFSWHAWKNTDSKTLLAILCTCLITKIGSLLGIIGSFKSIQDLRYKNLDNSRVRIATGHQILMVAFYFLIMVLMAFIIFGTRALFYSDRSIAYLDAQFHSSHSDWVLRYGETSLENIEKWALLMTNVAGYTCYIIVCLILLITYLLLAITMTYGIINSITSLISLGILVLGWSIVYILVYAVMFRQQMGFDISLLMLGTVVALAFSLGVIAVFGYILAVTDKVKYLKKYIFLCAVGSFLAVLSFSGSVAVSRSLVKQLGEECYDFMSMVDESYINALGCGEKYLNVRESEELACDKTQQRYIWEQRGNYGCLNPLCCQILITDSKSTFDYLGVCSASAIVMILISLWSCYYLYCKSQIQDLESPGPQDHRILVALVLLSVLWVYLITFHLPSVPKTVPYKNAGVVVNGAGIVDPRLLNSGYCIVMDPIELTAEKCEECSKTEFWLAIAGGEVVRGDNLEEVKIENTDNGLLVSDIDLEKVKEVANKAKLCPLCGDEVWDISIYRTDTMKTGEVETNPM